MAKKRRADPMASEPRPAPAQPGGGVRGEARADPARIVPPQGGSGSTPPPAVGAANPAPDLNRAATLPPAAAANPDGAAAATVDPPAAPPPASATTKPAAPKAAAPQPQPHEPSGETCHVAHGDGEGPCERCRHCRAKFRPSQMKQPCPARAAAAK